MPIEIKELRIKVQVVESNDQVPLTEKVSSVKWQEMKASIVRECTSKVLEKIKERAER